MRACESETADGRSVDRMRKCDVRRPGEEYGAGCARDDVEGDGGQVQSRLSLSLRIPQRPTLFRRVQIVRAFSPYPRTHFLSLFKRSKCADDASVDRATAKTVSSKVQYGLIPREHWVQPSTVDEDRAKEGRDRMEKEGVDYAASVPCVRALPSR
jgi:hypothetical protein